MKAMIFAAGLGTRLKPLTDTMPKALLPIAGKTLIQWQIEQLRQAGICDIVVNVHHLGDRIIRYLHQNNGFGCHIAISDERDMLLETGGGLYHARHLLCDGSDEPILACNADILSNIRIADLQAAFRPEMMSLLVVSERTTQRYLLFDNAMRLHGWTNIATGELRPADLQGRVNIVTEYLQPAASQSRANSITEELQPIDLQSRTNIVTGELQPTDIQGKTTYRRLAFSGMQILSPAIFDCMDAVMAQKGQKFSLIDLYLSICATHPLYGYLPTDYRMMDVGKIDQLAAATAFAQSLVS